MTAMATFKSEARLLGLPKNRTGLFAADTIHEVKPTRNQLINVPALSPQFRHNTSTNLLLASSEQNHHQVQQFRSSNHEIQQFYPLDKTPGTAIDSSNDSRATASGIRNGFRPSTIRHQKLRSTTAGVPRNEMKDTVPKSALMQLQPSAKLRSDVDPINNKLIRTKESSKSLRLANTRDLEDNLPSTLSYTSSFRESSVSSQQTADRIHQRFSSAITHLTANTRPIHPTSHQASQISQGLIESPSPTLTIRDAEENDDEEGEEEEQQQQPTDEQLVRTYQIPQQSNVGMESIFLLNPPPIKKRSARYNRSPDDMKSVSCPFYVMYFSNLTMQQRQNQEPPTNDRSSFAVPSSIRRVPVNSRTSTAYPKRQLTRRQVNSPISTNTYSTLDENDAMTNSSSVPHHKRLSTKTSSIDSENLHQLRDILRTTSLNHVQV